VSEASLVWWAVLAAFVVLQDLLSIIAVCVPAVHAQASSAFEVKVSLRSTVDHMTSFAVVGVHASFASFMFLSIRYHTTLSVWCSNPSFFAFTNAEMTSSLLIIMTFDNTFITLQFPSSLALLFTSHTILSWFLTSCTMSFLLFTLAVIIFILSLSFQAPIAVWAEVVLLEELEVAAMGRDTALVITRWSLT